MSANALTKKNDLLPSFVDEFFTPWKGIFEGGLERKLSMPAVNVSETKDEYKLSVAAAGLKKQDFSIDMDGNMLTISAETKEDIEEKDKNYTRREYNYSSFSRTFTVPDDVEKEKIDAHYENGVLNVMLPKKEEAKTQSLKTIAVK
ncbi:Hsp20/alpha crystallin family protein [soil metagenome]